MKPVFVDTSALIALGNEKDKWHKLAHQIRKNLLQVNRTFITTSAVLLEVCNAFSNVKFRPTAIKIIEDIHKSDKWKIFEVDSKLTNKGFERFKQMTDKDWSLIDCIGMEVAKEQKITEIFTTDHHFEQAGFVILLKMYS